MSFFACGFNGNVEAGRELETILYDLVPEVVRDRTVRIENPASFLVAYGAEQIIQHVVISSEDDDSWLAILGTPLVRLQSDRERQEFLREFIAAPGRQLLDRVDGQFAALAYDAKERRFFVGADFNNSIPVYYAITSRGILCCSHELALARLLSAEIDGFGFSQVLSLGVAWGSHTRFVDLRKSIACQITAFDGDNRVQTETYWRPQDEELWTCGFDEAVGRWLEILGNAVLQYYELSNRRPVAADFTAGEDSRLLVSQCHSLGIPFTAQVTGSGDELDVIIATRAAKAAGFDLKVRDRKFPSEEDLLSNAVDVVTLFDGYLPFFKACSKVATDKVFPPDDYARVKYCGLPGGEAFRGSYYWRGKAPFPSRMSRLDHRFFTRMKYLLDHEPGLSRYPSDEFVSWCYGQAEKALEEVGGFPIGTRIDHLLRVFQTCFLGTSFKAPLYLPFATSRLTRSIYNIPPRFKQGGGLTKACTEALFPELARVRTQHGVPTIRKTLWRSPLFIPEYLSTARGIARGAVTRLWKWKQPQTPSFNVGPNSYLFRALLNEPPYSDWFSSASTMVTGYLYDPRRLDAILSRAKLGSAQNITVLGQIISQELACRWVRGKKAG